MNKEFLHMQKLAGIITESEYKAMLSESKFEIVGPDVDELLDVISLVNGRGPDKSPYRDTTRLKPLNTTGHQIADDKFSIEVELVSDGSGKVLPNDSEYIQKINSFLEERGYNSKLVKTN